MYFDWADDVPHWLYSFSCIVLHVYKSRCIVRSPIDDNRRRIVKLSSLLDYDPQVQETSFAAPKWA